MHIFSSLLEVSFLKIYGKLRKNNHHFKYVCRKQGYFLFALQEYLSSRQLLLGFTYTQTYSVLIGPHLSLHSVFRCFFQNHTGSWCWQCLWLLGMGAGGPWECEALRRAQQKGGEWMWVTMINPIWKGPEGSEGAGNGAETSDRELGGSGLDVVWRENGH